MKLTELFPVSVAVAKTLDTLPTTRPVELIGSQYIGTATPESDFDFLLCCESEDKASLYLDLNIVLTADGWSSCLGYADLPSNNRVVFEKTFDGVKVNLIITLCPVEYGQMLAAARICKALRCTLGADTINKQMRATLHAVARGNFNDVADF